MGLTSNPIQNCWIAYFSPSISRLDWTQTVYEIPGEQDNWASFCCFYTPAPRRGRGAYCFTSVRLSVLPSIQDIFRRIFLSNCWWQKSDIWSQASYRYTILWVAFLDPSDSYFLFADFVGFYTHWTYMHIFRHIFLSNYRYPISWEVFLDPSDSYFLFADFVDFYTHWTYMHIFSRNFLSNYWWQNSDIWSQAS